MVNALVYAHVYKIFRLSGVHTFLIHTFRIDVHLDISIRVFYARTQNSPINRWMETQPSLYSDREMRRLSERDLLTWKDETRAQQRQSLERMNDQY